MNNTVLSVENLTKRYFLGVIGTGTLTKDLNRWWARLRGKPDPTSKIFEVDRGNRTGNSILALDDVSFTVQKGETIGIIGKNGAGKSTLLKILSRVTAPTSGIVRVKGRIGSLLEVGTGFHPELTGKENVFLNGAILGMRKEEVESKFDEIVDFSGVGKFIDTPVKRYSSGMYVRLAFAVSAHLDPEILVVDEVLAVGDAEFQKKCLGKMSDVSGEGTTVLLVSHNMRNISDLCQKTILLRDGKIEKIGKTREVIDHYIKKRERIQQKVTKSQVKERKYIGPSEISAVWLENQYGKEDYHYLYQDDIVFCMDVENIIENAIVRINVRNAQGQLIADLSNVDDKFVIKPNGKRATIKILLENLVLRGGDYYVWFLLYDQAFNLFDKWIDALSFQVDDTNIGQSVTEAHVRFKAKWSIEAKK
jgi:lipopolysaccharide transport system ATP-binding protein